MSPRYFSSLGIRRMPVLMLVALAVMAVAGSIAVGKPVQAAAGKIYVANEWSKRTNENFSPTGYNFSSTVFSTFADTSGIGVDTGRIIKPRSDIVKVVVVDPDLNPSAVTTVTDAQIIDVTGGSSFDNTISHTIGSTVVIQLTGLGATQPIAGTLTQVQANTVLSTDGGATNLAGHELVITNFFAGSAGGDPWIQVVVAVSGTYTLDHIRYQTTVMGTALVTVKSALENNDITFLARERGLGSGRYEGFIQLVENGVTKVSGDGSAGTTGVGSGAVDIFAGAGQVALSFKDNAGTTQETLLFVDDVAPTNTVTGPSPGSATQMRQPVFSGTIADSGSGLKISEIDVRWDNGDDAVNVVPVVNIATGNNVAAQVMSLNVSKSGAVDGDTAFSFSKAPPISIPNIGAFLPDNIVDWVIISADMAGNVGLSDSDPVLGGVQLPTVRIDNVIPAFTTFVSDHRTGLAWNGTNEVVARNSLRVAFNDGVANIQTTDFLITLDSGAVVVPTGVTVLNALVDANGIPFNTPDGNQFTFDELLRPVSFAARSLLYLALPADLISSDTPRVSLQDLISDLAGNYIGFGEREVSDGLGPSLIVTLSGGSGTGTGDEGPDRLTKTNMTISVESDEALASSPLIRVFSAPGNVDDTPQVLFQGGNTWTATFDSEGGPDGFRAIRVEATDVTGNTGTLGSDDRMSPGTPVFRLDTSIPAPLVSVSPTDPAGSAAAVSLRPEITIDHIGQGEESTVTLLNAQLDGGQVAGEFVRSGNGRVHIFTPSVDLAVGLHELVIPASGAVDAAGNQSFHFQFQFTVEPPPSAECQADTDQSGAIERSEAIVIVVSYLLGRNEWTREETLDVLTAYLLQSPLTC